MSKEHIEHITSSPLYPRSNGFIECQIKTIKTALSTCQESKQSVEDLLLNIRTQPIGPHLPSPREILHNRTEECPGKPSQPVNMEDIRNYLISKKTTQKENYNKHHNTKTLPDITPVQNILFLSPAEPHQYIEGAITSHASTPRSYIIVSQGRSYHRNCQHIHPLNPIITRPSPVKQPDSYTNTVITRPSPTEHQPESHINPTITRPSPASAAEQQSDSHTKPNISGPSATMESLPNIKPTISRPPMSKPVPAPRCKFLTRPSKQNQRYSTTSNFDQILAHLTAINQPQALEPMHEDQVTESSPSSPATTSTDPETETTSTGTTTDTSSDASSSDDTMSTSSEISTTSMMSDRQLRPRYPINYNKTVLTKLHGLLQIKTFNNLSIPLPVTESESEEDENYEHYIKPDTQTFNNQI